jgi:LEA14-like dessication related protein
MYSKMVATFLWLSASMVVFGLSVTGCSTIAEQFMEKPKVVLQQVNLREVTISGATVVFQVMVDNPNAFGINLSRLNYHVEIGGRAISSGALDQGLKIEANQQSLVELPVPVRYSDIFSSAFEALRGGSSSYRVKGSASFGQFTVPFDEVGDIKFKR